PYRKSSSASSSQRQPHMSRAVSLANPTLPNSRRAPACASRTEAPLSIRSVAAICKWCWISFSSSFSRFPQFHHCFMTRSLSSPDPTLARPLLFLVTSALPYFFPSRFLLLVSQRHHRIDAHRAPGRNVACHQRHHQ